MQQKFILRTFTISESFFFIFLSFFYICSLDDRIRGGRSVLTIQVMVMGKQQTKTIVNDLRRPTKNGSKNTKMATSPQSLSISARATQRLRNEVPDPTAPLMYFFGWVWPFS